MSSDIARYFPEVLGHEIDETRVNTANANGLLAQASPADTPQADEQVANPNPVSVEASDETLIFRICNGDKEALALLFTRYARLVRAVAFRILRDGAEADDLLQDLFLFINSRCKVFDDSKGSARSWIVQMAYHRAIDRRRYLVCRHFYTHIDLNDPAADIDHRRAELTPYEQSMEGVLGPTAMEKMKRSLTPDQQTTIRLYFFEGYKLDEIATHLNQSIGNVRNHYYRGLERMRKHLFSKGLRADQ